MSLMSMATNLVQAIVPSTGQARARGVAMDLEDLLLYLRTQRTPTTVDPDTGALTVHGSLGISGAHFPRLPAGMTVQGTLWVTPNSHDILPERLTVQGTLELARSDIETLPQGLTVHGVLNLRQTKITMLPEDLRTYSDVVLAHSPIQALPENFRVLGDLDLISCPIEALPAGLHVEGALNLFQTKVQVLPKSMYVGGMITPSTDLLDIVSFLDTRPPETRQIDLSLTSMHQRLQLQEELKEFPDLWRVLSSMPHKTLSIMRGSNTYSIDIR